VLILPGESAAPSPPAYGDLFTGRVLPVIAVLLHPDERRRTCIFGQNYGQAGAIDLFGPELWLPKAISAHNSYFLWGPRDCSGEVLIVIGDDRERLESFFSTVDLGATYVCDDCMPYENHEPIWIARGLKRPLGDLWPAIKKYI